MNKNKAVEEKQVLKSLEKICKKTKGRIFITLFSSNIHRIQGIFEIAKLLKKKVALLGRSLESYLESAQKAKIFTPNTNLLETQISQEKNDTIYLVSGCQGETRSSLRNLCSNKIHGLSLQKKDTVVFSSTTIPGNTKNITSLYNMITEKGAEVITRQQEDVHSSGHGSFKDIQLVINSINPSDYIPIHGESLFLKKHQELIKKHYPKIKTYLLLNGQKVFFNETKEFIEKESSSSKPLKIYGNGRILEQEGFNQRVNMASRGSVLISFSKKRNIFELSFLGFCKETLTQKESLKLIIKKKLSKNTELFLTKNSLEDFFRQEVNRFFKPISSIRPVTVFHNLDQC